MAVLSDLIGDLSWTDTPIEVKLFSNNTEYLKKNNAPLTG